MKMSKIIVIGGGAAGMMAAIAAAQNGNQTEIFEKNEKLGKKLFITGKGRCNITNACDMETLMEHVTGNARFLYSAFYKFNNYDMLDFLDRLGLSTKIERGNRVFPMSDKSYDVIDALKKELNRLRVKVHLNTPVKAVIAEHDKRAVCLSDDRVIEGDRIVIATGGISYQSTGSTGDGYRFGRELGHQVTELSQGLVPFNVKEAWVKELQGLSLKNIRISIRNEKKELYSDFGEMLFTHFGVSGPVIISASSHVTNEIKKGPLKLVTDLKPALSREQLDARILREFEANKNKQVKNMIGNLLPSKMVPVMLSIMGISPDKKIHEISREERGHMVSCFKNFTMTLESFRDYNEAIITRGGISVKQINPSTMESKIVPGIYFAGEVLDVDALTGGFNLQIAWSTGYLAGLNAGNVL